LTRWATPTLLLRFGQTIGRKLTRPIKRVRDQTSIDMKMMQRCIELSRIAVKAGELPFAALICPAGSFCRTAIG
jgi:hypothetical protein